MTETIGQRLLEMRNSLHLSQKEIAETVGVSPRTWVGIENEETLPGGATLLKIAALGFNPGWILTGIGEMRLPEPSQAGLMQTGDRLVSVAGSYHGLKPLVQDLPDDPFLKTSDLAAQQRIRDEFALLPRYEVRAAAGAGQLAVTEEVTDILAFRREWLRRMGINPATAFLLAADGDSMEPSIPNGALLLVDGSIRGPGDIKNGGIYVLVRSGTLIVKRVQFRLDDSVVLISDNPMYERETFSRDAMNDLHVAGRVIWIGRSL